MCIKRLVCNEEQPVGGLTACLGGFAAGYRRNQGDFGFSRNKTVVWRVLVVDGNQRDTDLRCGVRIGGCEELLELSGSHGAFVNVKIQRR
ncbi:hypothetical protein D3C73_1362190 [compost metagenome]